MFSYLSFLLLLNSIQPMVFLNLVQIDSPYLLGLFQSIDGKKTIKTDLPIPENTLNEYSIKFMAFFEEQCAIKCLRNIHCIRYVYNSDRNICQINLLDYYKRHIKHQSNEAIKKITTELNCAFNDCSGFYCSSKSSTATQKTGTCLCNPSSGTSCDSHVIYELGVWSEWTQCTANCDQANGFKKRRRNCLKTVYDEANGNVTDVVDNMDWLCEGHDGMYGVESCSVASCRVYGEWSEWSVCSKLCGGYTQRTRGCLRESDCDEKFLSQIKVCTLENCDSIVIGLDQTQLASTNTEIIKHGYLKFLNVFTDKFTKIFTTTDNQSSIDTIGHIACHEFGFKALTNIRAIKANNLRAQFTTDQEYLDFLNSETVSGIECDKNNAIIKDCKAAQVKSVNTELFELEIECTYDGYWSPWSDWSQCSATCGAGAKTRSRACDNPPPSISEMGGDNGATCANAKRVELTSCYQAKCEDNDIIF